MQDDKIGNINDEISKIAKGEGEMENEFESEVKDSGVGRKGSKSEKKKEVEEEYILTVEEKIEYFYQLIGVDNVHDFRKKMSELGLPLFKQYQPAKPVHKRSSSTKSGSELLNVIIENNEKEDERRLIELREKLNIKKERDKHMYSPTMTKEEYEDRKKRREEKQLDLMKEMNVSKVEPNATATK